MRDLVYYVATSIDGYIAASDGAFTAFPQDPATLRALFTRYPETCPAHARAALGITEPPRRFDTVIMGYKTYEPALAVDLPGGAYPHLHQVVATHRHLPEALGLTTISGDLTTQVTNLKAGAGRDIWLCGGAHLAAQLMDLIDEIQVKVNPVILGDGIPLLPSADAPRPFCLTAMEELPGEVALLTYRLRRDTTSQRAQLGRVSQTLSLRRQG
ncbi:deaminase [Kocuria tytonicola]|uniref:dihydrofolate reductase family protein n=1 Tax=Kocuria tytonicola TaxID=2055946 RepID=UPI000EF96622|nr:dihydrofolate reductase family protein [Kocuria tytonicola]RLZ04406.1 deaminase [Kocuria tytonicola]